MRRALHAGGNRAVPAGRRAGPVRRPAARRAGRRGVLRPRFRPLVPARVRRTQPRQDPGGVRPRVPARVGLRRRARRRSRADPCGRPPLRPPAPSAPGAWPARGRLPVHRRRVRLLDDGPALDRPRGGRGEPDPGVAHSVRTLREARRAPLPAGSGDASAGRRPARLRLVPGSGHQPADPPGLRRPRPEGVDPVLPGPDPVLEPGRRLRRHRRAPEPDREGRAQSGPRRRVPADRAERAGGDRRARDFSELAESRPRSAGDRERQGEEGVRVAPPARGIARRGATAVPGAARRPAGRGAGAALRPCLPTGRRLAHGREGGHGADRTRGPDGAGRARRPETLAPARRGRPVRHRRASCRPARHPGARPVVRRPGRR